eukprot:CAMPEP_0119129938 /NCGR_PEP_ID=MMETSP1310-20130426/7480_1 /TAXON_ID=464262 /ORGANISM="Genus nov. species nov., Strain RCC2339" /LENGTH=186 /DNA_ID=CAMNT_0007120401 /DNA_START=109 /DNA_END=669 /DNA_ORIENTATION=-
MSEDYGTYESGQSSEPFLSAAKISDSQHNFLIYGIGAFMGVVVLVTFIMLVVYAFLVGVVAHIMLAIVLLAMVGNVLVLFRFGQSSDVDAKFKFILLLNVGLVIAACVVGITYSVTFKECTLKRVTNFPCTVAQVYYDPTGSCMQCPDGYGLNTTQISNQTDTAFIDGGCGEFVDLDSTGGGGGLP